MYSIRASVEIFCSALIIESLSFVSSTLQASARNSFFLEIARFISGSKIKESKYKNNHKIGNALFFLDLVLINIYQIVQMIHINTFVITIVFTSQFII
jgi:hypothetical protein